MSARFHTTGRDAWANPGHQTVWQRERMRGPLLPMLPEELELRANKNPPGRRPSILARMRLSLFTTSKAKEK